MSLKEDPTLLVCLKEERSFVVLKELSERFQATKTRVTQVNRFIAVTGSLHIRFRSNLNLMWTGQVRSHLSQPEPAGRL